MTDTDYVYNRIDTQKLAESHLHLMVEMIDEALSQIEQNQKQGMICDYGLYHIAEILASLAWEFPQETEINVTKMLQLCPVGEIPWECIGALAVTDPILAFELYDKNVLAGKSEKDFWYLWVIMGLACHPSLENDRLLKNVLAQKIPLFIDTEFNKFWLIFEIETILDLCIRCRLLQPLSVILSIMDAIEPIDAIDSMRLIPKLGLAYCSVNQVNQALQLADRLSANYQKEEFFILILNHCYSKKIRIEAAILENIYSLVQQLHGCSSLPFIALVRHFYQIADVNRAHAIFQYSLTNFILGMKCVVECLILLDKSQALKYAQRICDKKEKIQALVLIANEMKESVQAAEVLKGVIACLKDTTSNYYGNFSQLDYHESICTLVKSYSKIAPKEAEELLKIVLDNQIVDNSERPLWIRSVVEAYATIHFEKAYSLVKKLNYKPARFLEIYLHVDLNSCS